MAEEKTGVEQLSYASLPRAHSLTHTLSQTDGQKFSFPLFFIFLKKATSPRPG